MVNFEKIVGGQKSLQSIAISPGFSEKTGQWSLRLTPNDLASSDVSGECNDNSVERAVRRVAGGRAGRDETADSLSVATAVQDKIHYSHAFPDGK
ncbi:MAG: hypothetical protein LBR80_13515 [Deltaproteobacteria bacterium]|nr:hypothetical protein [Deltaproteobacteria bacterium]